MKTVHSFYKTHIYKTYIKPYKKYLFIKKTIRRIYFEKILIKPVFWDLQKTFICKLKCRIHKMFIYKTNVVFIKNIYKTNTEDLS